MDAFRFRVSGLAVVAVIVTGCGGDSGGSVGTTPGTDAGQSGGQSNGGSGGAGGTAGGTSSTGGANRGGSGASGGAGGGTTDAGQGGAGGTSPGRCGSVTCDPAATCTADKCVCPTGSTDKNADGTECTKDNGGSCSSNSECTNGHCIGGSCCEVACTTPGACEKLDGTVCAGGKTCQYGKLPDVDPVTHTKTACDDGNACTTNSCFNGTCTVDSTTTCNDNDKCTTDSCDPTTAACSHTVTACNDNNPCTTDSCSATVGCQYTPNTASCDDNDKCTTGDVCTDGACKGAGKDCSALTNACATGECVAATGACAPTPKNLNGICSNGIGACDATGTCNASGACVGDNKACGAIATSCVSCTSGAQCFGAPTGHDCTCPATSGGTPVIEVNGKCVLNNDECVSNPCGPYATGCSDPTPSAAPANDYLCTCGPGTAGNTTGSACVDKNECTAGPNPCGNGTCTNANPPLKYSCACNTGFNSTPTATGPVCACDMNGTFVESVTTMVSWNNVGGGVIANPPAGGVPSYAWSLRQQTVAADGTMTAVTVPCGGVAPTLCDTSTNHLAYAQFQPVTSWGKAKMRSGFPLVGPVNLGATVPGGSYAEAQAAAIMGLDLKDPAGPWPQCRACVGPGKTSCVCGGTTYNITNPSTWWSDAEGTQKQGVTTLAVRQGGDIIGDATLPDPPINYGLPSECPRGTGGSNYTAWPGFTSITNFFTTNKWYGASRIISGLASTSISNSCVISGNVTGPDAGKPHSDARIVGCEKLTPTAEACREPTPAAPSAPDEVGFYDGVPQTQSIQASTFTLEKAPAGINLATIFAMPETNPTEVGAKETALVNACQAARVKYCPASTPFNTVGYNTPNARTCN